MLQVKIVLGSTREGRQGEKVAKWIYNLAAQRNEWQVELLDLRNYPLPFFNEPKSPAYLNGNYQNDIARKWAAKIGEADAVIFVTPEYNHGYPGVLKNAIDYVYKEWNQKAAGFVSYSSGIGAGIRAVEQLRQVVIELQMAPIREAVHIPGIVGMFDENGNIIDESFNVKAQHVLDQLNWWGSTLKQARF